MMPTPPAIHVDKLAKRYGRIEALKEVSFDVGAGEFFALLGPNGAGKTTLAYILCTLLSADSGTAEINGIDVRREPLRARSQLGVVFQEPSLDDRLTVVENLNFHGLVFGVPTAVRHRRIDEMLAVVELTEWRQSLVRALSSGMKRRLEIARALIHDSRILFLDEPTVGLDAQSRDRIWHYVRRLREERGVTVIVTTHYIEEVETCDRVCVIDKGSVLALASPHDLKLAYGGERLHVIPRDASTNADILTRYPDVALPEGQSIVLKSPGDSFVDNFLAEFGSRIRGLSIDEPSLEDVFLSLTGRQIRDQAVSGRDRTLAFGRQGGEHTR